MSLSLHTSLTRALCGSVAPVLALALMGGCSGGAGGGPEATSKSSQPILRTDVTERDYHPEVGHDRGPWDDEKRCHPAPLLLCNYFDDQVLGGDGGPACLTQTTLSCPDRIDTWDNFFVFAYATAESADCRFGQWGPPVLTTQGVIDFLNNLVAFTLDVFGCPAAGTNGQLTFALFPPVYAGTHFTTADLDAMGDDYIQGIQQGLSDLGIPQLTVTQVGQLEAKMHRMARRVPGVIHSRHYTFSTCAPGTVSTEPTNDIDDVDEGDVDCDGR